MLLWGPHCWAINNCQFLYPAMHTNNYKRLRIPEQLLWVAQLITSVLACSNLRAAWHQLLKQFCRLGQSDWDKAYSCSQVDKINSWSACGRPIIACSKSLSASHFSEELNIGPSPPCVALHSNGNQSNTNFMHTSWGMFVSPTRPLQSKAASKTTQVKKNKYQI